MIVSVRHEIVVYVTCFPKRNDSVSWSIHRMAGTTVSPKARITSIHEADDNSPSVSLNADILYHYTIDHSLTIAALIDLHQVECSFFQSIRSDVRRNDHPSKDISLCYFFTLFISNNTLYKRISISQWSKSSNRHKTRRTNAVMQRDY